MKQKSQVIKLLDFTQNDHPYGNVQGKEVFRKLSDYIDTHPNVQIFGISLQGIVATDASFPRESVIAAAKRYRETKGFYLEQVSNKDILDNWKYAAQAMEQPLVYWRDGEHEVLGPEITSATKELIDYVLTKEHVLASEVALGLGISIQNASTRLKKLVDQGYILRREDVADTGGIEFVYHAIK